MPPKKGKKGRRSRTTEVDVEPKEILLEVDKQFYELQIADLNKKLARLRSHADELETKNIELQTSYDKLDEDRAAVIAYLKRSLTANAEEIEEMAQRLRALQEAREAEQKGLEDKIIELENEYRIMHEQLTSEIKLLAGKLNSLEEFRLQRADLLKKFDDQEIMISEQEMRHKKEMYDSEREFVLAKNTLKKDMEARLLQLSSDFQNATELRIAATSQRVFRENIAINNEMDDLMRTQQRLMKENEELKSRNKTLRQEAELHGQEKMIVLDKNKLQFDIINKLAKKYDDASNNLSKLEGADVENKHLKKYIVKLQDVADEKDKQIRILKQRLHASKVDTRDTDIEVKLANHKIEKLKDLIFEAAVSIKMALKIQQAPTDDEAFNLSKREGLLKSLLDLLDHVEDEFLVATGSIETISTVSEQYIIGDLGLIAQPKKPLVLNYFRNKTHQESQVTASVEMLPEICKTVRLQETAEPPESQRSSIAESKISKVTEATLSKESIEPIDSRTNETFVEEMSSVSDETLSAVLPLSNEQQ